MLRRENILIYGVEEIKEDNDDGEKVLFKIADELEIDLEDNEIQRVHRLGQKRRNKVNPRPIIARFVSYKKINEFLTNKRELKKEDSTSSFVKISHLYGTSYWSTCKNPVLIRLPLATLEMAIWKLSSRHLKMGHRRFTWWSLQTRN